MTPRLALPVQRAPEEVSIVQPFAADPDGYQRFGLRGHNGLDFATEPGELVVAVDDGEVVELRLDPAGYGVTVKLSHSWGESRYAHGRWLSVPIEFELGHRVARGDRVFLAAGDHLHFGLRLRRDDGSLDYSNANAFGGWDDPLPCLRQALRLPAESPRPAPAKGKKTA
jgi:murein DD-endopeptidase MepM/ murein hydrolase activator NlpD